MKKFLLIALFFVFAYGIPSIGRPMLKPDEFRYGEIAAEMLQSRDFTTPRLLGGRYFEKPPLGYWVTAGAIRVFGRNAFAVRFMSLLGTAGAALLLAEWVRQSRRDNDLAALAAILYLGSGLILGLGTVAVLDSLLCCFTTGTLGSVFLALEERRFSRRRVFFGLLAGVFAGLAFLTKGFIAFVIPALTTALYLVVERRWREFLLLPPLLLPGVLAVSLPWALRIHAAEPDFWRYFIVEEHWKRFTDGSDQHPAPWWVLIPVLIGGSFPAALMLSAVFGVERDRWRALLRLPILRFAAAGVVMPLIFFSASRGKLATYIAPCFAPLSVLMAAAVAAGMDGNKRFFHWVMTGWGYLLTVGGAGTMLFAGAIRLEVFAGRFPELAGSGLFFGALGAVACAGGVLMTVWKDRGWRTRFRFFWGTLAAGLATSALLPDFNSGKMPAAMLTVLHERGRIDPKIDLVFAFPSSAHAVAWCIGESWTRVYASRGEFDYGDRAARQHGEEPLVWEREDLRRYAEDPRRRRPVVLISDDLRDLPKFMAKYPGLQRFESGEFIAWRLPPLPERDRQPSSPR